MVVKITSGSNIQGLVSYNETKVSEGEAKVIFANNIIGNFDENFNSISIKDKVDSFKQYLEANNKTEKYTFHASLNPDPDDEVTEENYQAIAAQYMQAMGYGSQPYLVYLHKDIERTHIHIVSVRVDATGKKINSDWEKYRSDKIRKEIEQSYGLTPAEEQRLNEKQRQKREQRNSSVSDFEVSFSQNPNRSNDLKGVFKRTLSYAKTYNLASFSQYQTVLKQMNVGFEIVKNKAGVDCGIVYFALNEKGERTSNSIKASALGKAYGLPVLTAQFDKLAAQLKDKQSKQAGYNKYALDSLKKRIDVNIFAKYEHMSLSDFKRICSENKLTISLNINDTGRITGVTYIDELSKKVFKGSELGKKYSANAINDFVSAGIDDSIQRKDQKELLSQISTIYYQFRKANTRNYYYESTFLRNYGVFIYAISEELKAKNPLLSPEVISYSVNKYFNYKISQLSAITEKEKQRFKDNTETLYMYSCTLQLDQRAAFLKKNGIATEKDISTGRLRLISLKDANVSYLTDEVYSSVIWKQDQADKKTKHFSRNVQQLLNAIQKGEGEVYIKSLDFDIYSPKMDILNYLSDSLKELFIERMHSCVVNKFLNKTLDMSDEEFIQAALREGFIVSKNGETFVLNHYLHTSGSSEPVSRDLTNYLGDVDKLVYNSRNDISMRYKLFVNLNRAKSFEDAQRQIQFLKIKNKPLYADLKECKTVDEMIEKIVKSNSYLSSKSTISKDEFKEINRAIFSYYLQAKKASGFYWESDFIKSGLREAALDIKMKIAMDYPYLKKEEIDNFVDKFILNKEKNEHVYHKGDKRKFMEKNKQLALYALKLPKEQRAEFLQKCGFAIANDPTGNVRLMSDCGSHVYLDMGILLKDMIGEIPVDNVHKFSYQNISLFAAIAENDTEHIKQLKYSVFNPNADILKYIPDEATKQKVKDQMQFSALRGFLELEKHSTPEQLVITALRKGYIITKDKKSGKYYIKDQAYQGDQKLKLSEVFEKALDKINYGDTQSDLHKFIYNENKEVSRQYKLFVQLCKAGEREDLSAATKAISFIEKLNPELYKKLTTIKGSDKDKIEDMIALISDYDNNYLRPEKKKYEKKSSSRVTFLGFSISKGRKEKDAKIKKTRFKL